MGRPRRPEEVAEFIALIASDRALATGSDGPIARSISFFGRLPVMITPPIRTSSPVPTRSRVEMLPSVLGMIVSVAVPGVPTAAPPCGLLSVR